MFFKYFSRQILISRTFQDGLVYSSTFQACANPVADTCPRDQNFHFDFYQSPLILTELFQHDLINVSYLTACYLYQVMMTLHFLSDVTNDAESTQKSTITS